MSVFKRFREVLKNNYEQVVSNPAVIQLVVDADYEVMKRLYLDSFPQGSNPIVKERTYHDCNCCLNFIRNFGSVILLDNNGNYSTIWNFESPIEIYQPSIDSLNAYVLECLELNGVKYKFIDEYNKKRIGVETNMSQDGEEIYNHFFIDMPERFVNKEKYDSFLALRSKSKENKELLGRTFESISLNSVETILSLIKEDNIYRGDQWKSLLEAYLTIRKEFDIAGNKELALWYLSNNITNSLIGLKNSSIGVLLSSLTEGTDLESAVKRYESITAPENYRRPKAIFTEKMLKDAKDKLEELGLTPSLLRRQARLDDLSIENVLYINRNIKKEEFDLIDPIENDVFGGLTTVNKSNKRITPSLKLTLEQFLNETISNCKDLEILIENKHKKNIVTLITEKNANSKGLFKWDNPFSWSYVGNLASSSLKEEVAKNGGSITGDLRFSIKWNDEFSTTSDLDAHCDMEFKDGDYDSIYYCNKRSAYTKGVLDVDIISPVNGTPAVENITWATRDTMKAGTYEFGVHCFSKRSGLCNFNAEIEFDGEIYEYENLNDMNNKDKIKVATVTLDNEGRFSIKHHMNHNSSMIDKTFNGLKSNNFVGITAIMNSPNSWNNELDHNKHLFIMVDGCEFEGQPNGFYNEFLNGDLSDHSRVLEAISSKMDVETFNDGLVGVGFNRTKREEVIMRATINGKKTVFAVSL